MAALITAVVSRGAPLNQASGGAGAPVAVTSGGDTFLAGANVYLRFTNTGGSASVITVAAPGASYDGLAKVAPTFTCPATTGDIEVGPFPPNIFTPDGSTVSLTYTNPGSLKVAVKQYAAS